MPCRIRVGLNQYLVATTAGGGKASKWLVVRLLENCALCQGDVVMCLTKPAPDSNGAIVFIDLFRWVGLPTMITSDIHKVLPGDRIVSQLLSVV